MTKLGAGRQFLLLVWKELVLLKQKKVVTIFQILLPICFALLLTIVRRLVDNEDRSDTSWPSFAPRTNWNGDLSRNEILWAPNSTALITVMATVATKLGSNFTVTAFATEADLNTYKVTNPGSVWAAVIFDSSSSYASLPKDVKYTLRVTRRESSDEWRTDDTFPLFQQSGYRNNKPNGGEPYYDDTGFLGLQLTVDNAIINAQEGGNTFDSLTINMQKMSYIAHVSDGLIVVIQNWLPLFILLAFLITALQTTKTITYEKERRLKEAMTLMGMNSVIYWIVVVLKALIFSFIAIILFTIILKVKTGPNGSVLTESSGAVVFLFLLVYSVALIAFCVMMSTFFSKANVASNTAAVMYICMYVPWFFLTSRYEDMEVNTKVASCLLFNTAMAMGFNVIGIHESTGAGAQMSNLHKAATIDDNLSLLLVMVMLLVDAVIMLIIAWYVGNVFPGEVGVPKPFYFPFTKSYWCGGDDPSLTFDDSLRPKTSQQFFEREPEGFSPGIEIHNLRKVFGRGGKKKIAVAGTNLNMYKGQITALLGHNGAGKTTTMSMISGFIPPSSGTARVNGHDIVKNIEGVRRSLGFCPQHDILFDTMSVEDHLYFYGRMKGTPKDKIKDEIGSMIEILELQTKKNSLSMTLSGGQKRKLSVGIALIGGSEVVILDEPTSGMDPGARRQTWEILKRFRTERCMVLSTHFMDEADVLGDRIAIMAEGVVKCCGTPLFLKKAFGAGYHLVIVKSASGCNVDNITKVIQSHVPTAVKESEISMELSYLLPFDQSNKFTALFSAIEQQSSSLGIASFGASATTMEEVFLKVGESGSQSAEESANERKSFRPSSASGNVLKVSQTNGVINDAFEANSYEKVPMVPITSNGEQNEGVEDTLKYIEINKRIVKNQGIGHSFQQFYGMFVKKMIHTWRNRVVSFVQLLLPIMFTVFAFLVERTTPGYTQEPARQIGLSAFSPYTVIIRDGATGTYDDKYKTLVCSSCYSEVSTGTSFVSHNLQKMRDLGRSTFSAQYPIGVDFDSATNFTAYFNGEPFHTPAIALNFLNNAILRDIKSDNDYSIIVTNYPFDKNLADNVDSVAGSSLGVGFSIAFQILFGMAFLSTSFIIFLIKERMNGAKHLQKVSGVSSFTFWLSAFVWDYINYMIPVIGCVITFSAFNIEEYSKGSPSRITLVIWIFVSYGWTCLPFIYMFNYFFKTPASGMVAMTLLNIVTGLATLITVFVLNIPGLGTENVAKALDWVFAAIIPHYNLGMGIMNIYVNYNYLKTCEDASYRTTCASTFTRTGPCCDACTSGCLVFTENYLDMASPGIGKNLLFMGIQGVVFFSIILLAEYQVFTRILYIITSPSKRAVGSSSELDETNAGDSKLDDDVLNEKKRINENRLESLMESEKLIIKNMGKHYGRFHAVQNISIGIASQECFGLLGQNGAGKTTTFKMLTGDEMITTGNAYLDKFDVKKDIKQVQRNLGYCPQFDGLIEQMTGKEILYMYARLRGVQESLIKDLVNVLTKALMLENHAERQCGTYSGGNKRKLSTAIALIGDPPFIFLDEPTTGVDPGARRQLWNVFSQIRASGRTLVLTSHSMEECDALCTRIVIMVNGRFVCLGSPQHLKNKFGHGYTLIVQLGLKVGIENQVKEFVKQKFPSSIIFDNHQGYLHFQIPDNNISLSQVFGTMEAAKQEFEFEDYSVHQTTLEQVFLQFTRDQHLVDDRKKDKGCFKCC